MGKSGNHNNNLEMPVRTSLHVRAFYCLLLYFIAAASACAADTAPKTFDLTISRGAIPSPQRVLRVEKGDMVRLRLAGDAAGDLHLHGYRLEMRITPGSTSEFTFKAHATGRYRIEWHPVSGGEQGNHHGPPLATLEVRPRE
jgi:hypothetical protein